MRKSFYSIIPGYIRYDKTISANVKLLYAELTAMCNELGCCYASNNYFAEIFEVSSISISRWINILKRKKYIEVVLLKGNLRCINICVKPINVGDNMVDVNNIKVISKNIEQAINNATEEINPRDNSTVYSKFIKPNLEDVIYYFNIKDSNIDKDEIYQFYDFYESNGWKVGKNKMKDWKASIRNWIRNIKKGEKNTEKFPNFYDKKCEFSIGNDVDKLRRYHQHLRKLGWSCVHSPTAGTIWKKS